MKGTLKAALVEAVHVDYQYPEAPHQSLHDVCLSLAPHDCVLLVGANGCGKSTLLSLLAGRRKPQGGGAVRVMGADPFDVTHMSSHIALIGAPWPPEAVFGNRVEQIASPAPNPLRREILCDALHLRLNAMVDRMSMGERRRVQVLHGLLPEASVYLLDECSTNIDVVERETVLELVKQEVTTRNGCCLYATHVFDGVEAWATHVALMRDGELLEVLPVSSISGSVEAFARSFMAENSRTVRSPTFDKPYPRVLLNEGRDGTEGLAPTGQQVYSDLANLKNVAAIACDKLSYRNVFSNMSFSVPLGSRTLLCGCNGCGKSTLLNMLGGKLLFPNTRGELKILGSACYDNMKHHNALVAYGGDWWWKPPPGEMYVHQMVSVSTPRAAYLQQLLAVDLAWDVRQISAGECKRVQLFLHLMEDKPVVLLDEATADLDVDQRYHLLHFLYAESTQRGVTVMYATHIFDGLDGWAEQIIVLDRTTRGVYRVLEDPDSLDEVVKILRVLKAQETY